MLRWLSRIFARAPKAPPRPADPRLAADPWLGELFARLGERYQLGPDGSQILRRTGRARFNPMPVWLVPGHVVRGEYEVRGDPARGREILDARVTRGLEGRGLSQVAERVEEWAGTVLIRRYEGICEGADRAAAAV